MNNIVILLTWKMSDGMISLCLPCNTPRWQDLELLPSNSQFKFFFLHDKMKLGTFNIIFPLLS